MNLPDIETVSAAVHDAWICGKLRSGVTSRKSETGEELMVAYSELSEKAKELDRASVRAVYLALASVAGYPPNNGFVWGDPLSSLPVDKSSV